MQKQLILSGCIMIIVASGAAAADTPRLESAPLILDLGSNESDGAVALSCTGEAPYDKLSCTVYRLWIDRPSTDEWQKARVDLEKDLATKTESDVKRMHDACVSQAAQFNAELAKVQKYSPGRAATAKHAFLQAQEWCACETKACFTRVMLEQQKHDQNVCTVHSSTFSADFVRVNDRKWVSNNGPEGTCGVMSVFTIQHEPTSTVLWTYTEQSTVTNVETGLCKQLAGKPMPPVTFTYQSGAIVSLNCEEIKFNIFPQ